MLLIGLDAASQFKNFGYAVGTYEHDRVWIKQAGLVESHSERNALATIIAQEIRAATSALIAIDAPLGWPITLAKELINHNAGEAFVSEKDAMFRRETDKYVKVITGKNPLEVGADKIARAAHAALAALECLRAESGNEIPLAWSKNFLGQAAIEVYPAGTLKARGLPDSKYKKPEELAVRIDIASQLANEIDGLTSYADGSADVFDACLCLIAAKDFLDGLADPPGDLQLAQREGWIWVRRPLEK